MDVPEMVERVARALCTAAGINPEYWSNPLKVAQARAAIEAMMEQKADRLESAAEEYADNIDQGEKWGALVEAFQAGAAWASPSLKEQERT